MIKKIGHYSITNPASVYDEEALTALELAGRTAGKVNECVEHFNKLEEETNAHLEQQDELIPYKVEDSVQHYIDNGAFDEAIDEYAGELTDRVNNIVANAGDDNTELVDARLSAYGETYETTGGAIRGQFNEVARGTSKKNLINLNALTAGFIQTTGVIHPSHQTSTFQRWEYTTDYIPVSPLDPYTLTIRHDCEREGWYSITTYDANKTFKDRDRTYNYTASELKRTFTFPDDVAFVRISYRSYMTGEVKFEQSQYASKDAEKTVNNNLLDAYPLQFDGFILENGSCARQTLDGYIAGAPALKECYTRHIPVKAGESYTIYHNADAYAWGAVCFYDENGDGIQRITVSNRKNVFTIPTGSVSMMVCARTHYLKDFAIFKNVSPMTAEQRAYENYMDIDGINAQTDVNAVAYNVKAINHRGYNSQATENTLEAFRLSSEHGFKYVECDVRFTADGVPVLLHDETVDRISDGSGNIIDFTLTEAQNLNFGGQKIATFKEFIALCKGLGLHAYVELKAGTETQIKELVGIVRMYGMRDNVTYISFNSVYLEYAKNADKSARLGYVTETVDESIITAVKALKTGNNEVFIDASAGILNDELITLCATNNIPLEVWTVNNESYITSMNAYITGVTSDTVHAGEVLKGSYFTGSMTAIPATFEEESAGGEGGALYHHSITLTNANLDRVYFHWYTSDSTPITTYENYVKHFDACAGFVGAYYNNTSKTWGVATMHFGGSFYCQYHNISTFESDYFMSDSSTITDTVTKV